jgi:alpha-L-fucosidase
MKMRNFLLLAALLTNAAIAADQFSIPPTNSPELAWWRESMQTHDERIAWWREAKFGMFVHWGVYSGLGNEYKGRKGGGYAEHIQRVLKIPIAEYRREVAGNFNPTNFNADEWIQNAKEAGMGYFVITAKHHDGFAMWPSRVSDYNITNCTPFKRDPMRELRDACRKQGVKFGFYYSQAFDWGEANGAGNDWDYNNPGGDKLIGGRNWWETRPEFLPKARKYVDEKAIPQLQELVRLYDPDIFWFDTASKLPPSENLRIMKAVRAASAPLPLPVRRGEGRGEGSVGKTASLSHVVINGRLVGGLGDYTSTADRPAEFSPHEGDWEGIPTTNESYGWNKFDHSHKPPAHFIQLLAKAAARGGNILMNIGPMGDGRMAPEDVAILQGIGRWWKVNGESIRGTTRTPLPVQTWGESTRKGNTLYLHIFEWPKDGKLVIGGLKSNIKSAKLLAGAPLSPSDEPFTPALSPSDGERGNLRISRLNADDITIAGFPAAAPDKADTVIALECEDPIVSDPVRLLQPSCHSETLRVFDAKLHGKGLKFGAGKTRDAYAYEWTRKDQFISWSTRLNQDASYQVELVFDAEPDSASGTVALSVGPENLRGTVKAGTIQSISLGQVALKAGTIEIKLSAEEIKGSELMRPRCLILKSL